MNQMKKQVHELMQIQAPSGKEYKVRKYLMPRLEKLVDSMWVDNYGNLLGEVTVGSGDGATVVLSAHMDSVSNIKKDRKVLEKDGVFTSTKGVLGADDRAGIAIVMAVLRNVEKTSFEGKVKVAFSREEEIGCVGSGKIDKKFYEDSDLAIVVDRRGNRDIVTGTFGTPFCNPKVGNFFEDCSAMLDMDWKATEGGISDAMTFSDEGVNSVNLSAGYYNEHTPSEMLVFKHMLDTTNLILQAFAQINFFVGDFGAVPSYEFGFGYGSYGYFEDEHINEDYVFESNDIFGYTFLENRGEVVTISQNGKNGFLEEVMIEEETMDNLVEEYLRSKHGKQYTETMEQFKDKVALD